MDKEKVFSEIEEEIRLGEHWDECYRIIDLQLLRDILAMLKEQEDRIGVLTRAIKQMPKPTKLLDVFGDGYAKVVRCKNCKYCEYPDAEKEWCKKGHLHGNAETWFCADGERSVECE